MDAPARRARRRAPPVVRMIAISIESRRRRLNMRSINVQKKIFPAVIFAAALALPAAPALAVEVGLWTPADQKTTPTVVPDDYCNMKVPAPNNDKPDGNDEDQMTPEWQDYVDYSGPCDKADIDDAVRQMKQTSVDD